MKGTITLIIFKTLIFIAITLAMFCLPALGMEPLKIGVAYTSTSGMAERVLEGFTKKMMAMGIPIDMDYKTGLADLDELAKEVRIFEKNKDAVLIMRSTGARWLAQHPIKLPTFVAACNNPAQLGVVNNMQAPEGNVTGVTYYLPRDTQWEIFRAVLPDIRSIFLILEKGHPSSMVDHQETQAVCKKLGIKYRYKLCTSVDDAIATIEMHRANTDAFVMGTQRLTIDHADSLVNRFPDLIFLSYSSKQVENGALAGFVADDNLLGRKLAVSVRDVLVKGVPVRQVPVKFDRKPKFLLNAFAAERLHVNIPFEILQSATLIRK